MHMHVHMCMYMCTCGCTCTCLHLLTDGTQCHCFHAVDKSLASLIRQSYCLHALVFLTFGCSVTKIARPSSWHLSWLHSSSDRSYGTDTRHSGKITALLGLINFLATAVDLGRSHLHAYCTDQLPAGHTPHLLPSSICPARNPRSVGSDRGMGGYRVVLSGNTPVKSADSSTSVLGQSVGGVSLITGKKS